MKVINFFFLAFLLITIWNGQSLSVMTPLEDSLNETSGLLYLDGKIISFNDSNEPELYEIDKASGEITRTVAIENATNYDWEDITADDEYLYIGDVGNNFGDRDSLTIYRVALTDYQNIENDTVTAEEITFTYAEQTNFLSSLFTTNYDAEALVSYNDKLYVFTKNWKNLKSDVYAIPTTPGTYNVEKIDSIDAKGLITGASYNAESNTILLSGNSLPSPFIMELRDFTSECFSGGTIQRHQVHPPAGYSIQIEGIAFVNNSSYYLTAEGNLLGSSALYDFTIPEN